MVRFITSLLLLILLAQPVVAAELDGTPWSNSRRLELGNDFFVRDLRFLAGGELLVAGDQLILPAVTDGGPEPISYNYVQLHEPDGSLRWQVILPGSGRSAEYGEVAVNEAETEVFLTGQIKHADSTVRNLYVARIAISGEVIWQLELTDEADMVGRSIVAASDGGAFVAGSYLAPGSVTGPAGFMLRLTPEGEVAWTEWLPDDSTNSLNALALHPDGSVTAAGQAGGSVTGSRSGLTDTIMVTFDVTGERLWQLQFGSDGTTIPVALQADSQGLLLLGETLGRLAATEVAGDDVFVMRLSFDGEHIWSNQFGGNDNDRALVLAGIEPGSIHVAALFASYADAYAPVVGELGLVVVQPDLTVEPVGVEFSGAVGGTAIQPGEGGPVLLLAVNEGDGWYLHELDPRQLPAAD